MASNANKILEWSNRFKRFQNSDSTVSRFCRDEKVTIQAFYYWRDRIPQDRSQGRDHFALNAAVSRPNCPTASTGADDQSISSVVRFNIQVGSVAIQCESTSLQAIDRLLSWATGNQVTVNQASRFKQVI